MSTPTDSPRKDNNNVNDFKHAAPIPILSSPHRRRPSISSSDGSPTSPPPLQTPNSYHPNSLTPSSPTSSSFLSYFTSTSPKSSTSFPYRRPPGIGAPPVFEGRSQSGPPIDRPTDGLDRPFADDEGQEIEVRNTSHHQRRATTAWTGTGRTASSQRGAPAAPVIEEQHARGAGVLRRLSLGGGLNSVRAFHAKLDSSNLILLQAFFQGAPNRPSSPPPPATPPPSAVTPSATSDFAANQNIPRPDVRSRIRRSATLSVPPTNPRHRAPSPMGERILKGHFDSFN
jgi:hypothetical protein